MGAGPGGTTKCRNVGIPVFEMGVKSSKTVTEVSILLSLIFGRFSSTLPVQVFIYPVLQIC